MTAPSSFRVMKLAWTLAGKVEDQGIIEVLNAPTVTDSEDYISPWQLETTRTRQIDVSKATLHPEVYFCPWKENRDEAVDLQVLLPVPDHDGMERENPKPVLHRRVVYAQVGKPLYSFKSQAEFLRGFRAIVNGLQSLAKLQLEHRHEDISLGSLYLSQGPNPNSDPDVGVEGIISDFDLSILRCKPGPCSEPEHKETSMTQVSATMAVDLDVPSPVANLQFGGWTESSRGAHTAEEASIGPEQPFTSTIQFMAIGVLQAIYPSNLRDLPPSKRGIPRTPLHSLESAIYVASYSILYKCHVHGKELGFNKDDREKVRDVFEQQFGQTKIHEVLAARRSLTNSGNSMVFKPSIRDRFPIIVTLLKVIMGDIRMHHVALSRQKDVEDGDQMFRDFDRRHNQDQPGVVDIDAGIFAFSHDRVLAAIDVAIGTCEAQAN
ncbi:hypothetical protein K474DRAFT_1669835 [Panus rudis PR-1116 ss-1]|nr:hypothetical protein K474DRAFT_1669835 [Panus rudis PR-1116 ss-1]